MTIYILGLLFTLGIVIGEDAELDGVTERLILVGLLVLWPVLLGFMAYGLFVKEMRK